MFRPEPQKSHASHALVARLADLKIKLQEAHITDGEIKTFQKVAAVMEDSQGRIDGDDLIAASFLADPPLD
ncbi:hypothetical protein B5V02_24310 [Mesorhizobium kowhaii]|uniref:Uncharacterized protein n=2 Tax=Mesorhizobium kowhaii TaxID=1300272 RepID=A0A2W7C249_9HYPH|nr:hypothetical protein B5V02_24310 [Mesorhizobium kowhaii]